MEPQNLEEFANIVKPWLWGVSEDMCGTGLIVLRKLQDGDLNFTREEMYMGKILIALVEIEMLKDHIRELDGDLNG